MLASVLIVFLGTTALLGGSLVWTSLRIDQVAEERQTTRILRGLEVQLERMTANQRSIASRSGLFDALRRDDMGWLNGELAAWSHRQFRHDESYILLADGSVAYASMHGQPVAEYMFETRGEAIKALVAELRQVTARGYVDPPPAVADFVRVEGRPAIVGVAPIIPTGAQGFAAAGTEPFLVSIVPLDRAYEQGMIEQHMMEPGRFTLTPAPNDERDFPITNRQGRIVAFFEWTPYRPGSEMLQQAVPALLIGGSILALLVMLLAYRLWRAGRELESERLDAERRATLDPLTGLPNRLSFERELDARLKNTLAIEAPLCLIMLDLDRFKQVNDTFGHHAGDELIRMVGERLRSLTDSDDLVARLGGDEFAIATRCSVPERDLADLSTRIIEAIARPFRIEGNEAFVGVSMGIVISGPHDTDLREQTRKADIALYEAKASGRNRAAVYREYMDVLVQNRHMVEAELREALRQPEQLWVAYQPLFDRQRKVLGAEALVRWRHPRLGDVSPRHFIDVAESSGLIEQLGDIVLQHACRLGAAWPERTVAVNISPAQLRNPSFAGRVMDLLTISGMRPQDLEVEITEGILLDDQETASATLRALRRAGVRVALDDFGTGYSSLNYLKRYPVDRIKIDRSFVAQLGSSAVSDAIVQAMVTLAHAMNIEVTAEGVETEEQQVILTAMNCNTFQGYLLSGPVSEARIAALFEASRPLVLQPADIWVA